MAFSPDGGKLAGGSDDGVTIWEIESYKQIAQIQAQDMDELAFSPDNLYLISASKESNGKISVWRTEDWSIEKTVNIGEVRDIEFTQDGETLLVATGGRLLTIKVSGWALANVVFNGPVPFNGKRYSMDIVDFDLAPNEDLIAIGFKRRSLIGIFDYPSGKVRLVTQIDPNNDQATFAHPINQVSFSNAGEHLAFAAKELQGLIDVSDGTLIRHTNDGGYVARFSPSRDSIAFGEVVWDSEMRQIIKQSFLPTVGNEDNVFREETTPNVSPSGKWEVEIDYETGTITLLNTKDASIVYSAQAHIPGNYGIFGGHIGSISEIAFSLDDTFFVTGGLDRHVKLWQIAEEPSPILVGLMHEKVNEVAISPDNTIIVASDTYGGITAWRIADNASQVLFEVDQNSESYSRGYFIFTSDSRILVSTDHSGHIYLWQVSDGTLLGTLNGRRFIYRNQLSDDGTVLYTEGLNLLFLWGAK